MWRNIFDAALTFVVVVIKRVAKSTIYGAKSAQYKLVLLSYDAVNTHKINLFAQSNALHPKHYSIICNSLLFAIA